MSRYGRKVVYSCPINTGNIRTTDHGRLYFHNHFAFRRLRFFISSNCMSTMPYKTHAFINITLSLLLTDSTALNHPSEPFTEHFIIYYIMHPPFCTISQKRSMSAAVVILKFLSSPGIMAMSIPAITAGSVEPFISKILFGRSALFAS